MSECLEKETTPIQSIVIARMSKDGNQTFHVIGDSVRLFFVDENCPNDRVYEWLSRDSADEIKDILGNDPIGSSQDDRHEAIRNRVLKLIEGKRHLEVVEARGEDRSHEGKSVGDHADDCGIRTRGICDCGAWP